MPIRGCCKVASKSEKYPNRFGNHDRNEGVKAIDEKRLETVNLLSVPSSAALKRRKFGAKLKPEKDETSDENIECLGRQCTEGRVRKAKVFFGDLQADVTLGRSRHRARVRYPVKKLSDEDGLHANDRKMTAEEMCNINEYEVLSSFFLITTQNVSPMMRSEKGSLGNDAEKRKFNNDNEIYMKSEFSKNYSKYSLDDVESDLASESEAIMALATLRGEGE